MSNGGLNVDIDLCHNYYLKQIVGFIIVGGVILQQLYSFWFSLFSLILLSIPSLTPSLFCL